MNVELKIISTNIGKIREVEWRGQKITTGIFKQPVNEVLFLGKKGVNKDEVADQNVHGGNDKACYLYSSDCYPWWKKQFPDKELNWGIFGENLTVEGLDEGKVNIGDTFKIGDALVQVSQPRLPCYKLGIRFENPKVVKTFLQSPYPGVYVRVINEGHVKTGDKMVLVTSNNKGLSVREVYSLFSANKTNKDLKALACEQDYLSESIKKSLR